ncbi:MAG: hypothetical protein ACO31E_02730 [Phycisphaerales bacterium]
MPPKLRSNPHLRLTAAILVAMLAALSGSLDSDGGERTRRSEVQTLIGGLRLVSISEHAAPTGAHDADYGAAHLTARVCGTARVLTADRPEQRAQRRARLDASRASGASLLRTTALPPPTAC